MPKNRNRARVISYLLIAVVLGHTAVIALWAGPDNQIKKTLGVENIREYVNPFFEQDWHIFAPTPKRVSSEFDFRARLIDPDSQAPVETPWLSLTDGENLMILNNISPSRAAFNARRTSLPLHNAANSMNAEQRAVVEKDLAAGNLQTSLESVSTDEGANEAEVAKFLRYDEMATTLATLNATAIYGGEVVEVQFRTKKASVPRFSQRRARALGDVKAAEINYGWRTAPTVSAIEVAGIEPYVKYILRANAEPE